MIAVQFPYVALAKPDVPDTKTVASFSPLRDDMKQQTVPTGTEREDLILPDQLEAEIIEEPEENLDTATPSQAEKEEGESTPDFVYSAWIPVTWDSEPEYDGDTEGSYVFTADIGDYMMADSVKPPQITVTVENSEFLPPDAGAAKLASSLLDGGGEKVFESPFDFLAAMGTGDIQPGDVILANFTLNSDWIFNEEVLADVTIIYYVKGYFHASFGNVGNLTLKQGVIELLGKVESLTIEDGYVRASNDSEIKDITMMGGKLDINSSCNITGKFSYQGGTINGDFRLSGDGVFINDSDNYVKVLMDSNEYTIYPGVEMKAGGTLLNPVILDNVEGGFVTVSSSMVEAGQTFDVKVVTNEGYVFQRVDVSKYMGGVFLSALDQSFQLQMPYEGAILTPVFYSKNASLSSLRYQVNGEVSVDVPGFTGDRDTYHVSLPPDTPQDAVIVLKGVPEHKGAKVVGNPQITLSGGAGRAALTVEAEAFEERDADAKTYVKTYTVDFSIGSDYDIVPLSPNQDFGKAEAGYLPSSAAKTVSFENTGTLPLNVTGGILSKVEAFEVVNHPTKTVLLAAGETISYTIQPKSGLEPGVYEDTFTVHTAEGVTAAVNLKFTVTEKTVQTVTVTFDPAGGTRTGGGELIQAVPVGGGAAAPEVTRDGYTFTGWDKDFTKVTADMTVTALWKKNYAIEVSPADLDFGTAEEGYEGYSYTKTMNFTNTGARPMNITGVVLSKAEAFELESNPPGPMPFLINQGFTYLIRPKSGLAPGVYEDTYTLHTVEGATATGNLKFTVTKKTVQTVTVTFDPAGGMRTGGGELTQAVPVGGAAAAPEVARDGYTFTGWDKDFTKVAADMTVTASWEKNGFYGIEPLSADQDFGKAEAGYLPSSAEKTVSFENTGTLPLNVTGGILSKAEAFEVVNHPTKTVLLAAGETISYSIQPKSGLEPGVYEDTFTVHTAEGITAVVNLKFMVTEKTVQTVTVTFDLAGGTRTGGGELTQAVPAGGAAAAPEVTRNGYTFTGWDKDFTKVAADMTVTALWDKNTGSSDSGGDSSSDSSKTSSADASVLHGDWEQTAAGVWLFKMPDGSYAKNRWGQVNGLWYYFDAEGRMLTNWYYDQNYRKWFYFDPSGSMAVGWRQIDGKWYYFNPVSDGTKGAMAADIEVDGYTLGADGAAIH
ncbi:putative cell wall binding repeat protein [Hungatella effluvii]|uniref:Putative cell wall binding repeat protein n=2 Tax=Hungatella effluvii TaxID=1096246 RepID=A0A2V3Y726_9FIRM|nr:putative cell wall binding repeat protein [Hungatella effluvii]